MRDEPRNVHRYQTPRFRGKDGDEHMVELRTGDIGIETQPAKDGQHVTVRMTIPVELVTYRIHSKAEEFAARDLGEPWEDGSQ